MLKEIYEEGEIPLFHLIPVLYRMIDFNKIKKDRGLTKGQSILLAALGEYHTLCMGEIAEYISSSKEQSTRTVAALAERGLIERYELEENRKLVHIALTEKGRTFMEEMKGELCTLLRESIASALSPEEIVQMEDAAAVLLSLLTKVQKAKRPG